VSGQDHLFDLAFREHLAGVYFAIGRPTPPWLTEPIQGLATRQDYRPPSGYITPHLAGGDEAGLEWTGAGFLEPAASSGSMQRAEASVLRRLYFGYNPTCLMLRVETRYAIGPYDVSFFLRGESSTAPEQLALPVLDEGAPPPPFGADWRVDLRPGRGAILRKTDERASWLELDGVVESAAGERAWEVSLPLGALGLNLGDQVGVAVMLAREGHPIESIPSDTLHTFTLTERA
jgi:hypothetical protein